MSYFAHSIPQWIGQIGLTLGTDLLVNDKWEGGKTAEITAVILASLVYIAFVQGVVHYLGNGQYSSYVAINGSAQLVAYIVAQFFPEYKKLIYTLAGAAITQGVVPYFGGEF